MEESSVSLNFEHEDERLLSLQENGFEVQRSTTPTLVPGALNVISREYESLDYDTCPNTVSCDEQHKKGYKFVIKKDIARWIISFFIGALTAFVACCINIAIEFFSSFKFHWIQKSLNKCTFDGCLYIPFLSWSSINIGCVSLASFLGSYIEPISAGSGIPQVKCYLNGVKVPRVVRIKTLMSKALGVTFSVLGGLAVGKEGPMIHAGAVIAAGISQGKTTSFNHDFNVLHYFREDHEKRDFVSAGAAAGVAAAFGAPVGGVLFSLEEGASFWNQALTWRVLFSAMISTFFLNVGLSTYYGNLGNLNFPGLLNFGKFDDLNYQIYEIIIYILMGAIGGFLGALFNHINYKLMVFRMKYTKDSWQKILEACFVAFISATVGFLMILYIYDCRDQDIASNNYNVQMYCKDGQVSTSAQLWLKTPERAVNALFHDPKGSFGAVTVSMFSMLYFLLACWTYGLGVPSGLFIPTLLVGAAWGRGCGMLLGLLFPNQPWVDEGKFALVGAAAMLGGVVRMTLSLTVILMECVGNITFGLPLMLVLMLAKWVGDYFNEGLYEIHIRLSGAPLMAWEPPPISDNIFASEVMKTPLVTLNPVEKVSKIVDILKSNNHNGYPIVDLSDDNIRGRALFKKYGTLRGLILRSQLVVLLKHKVFNENDIVWQTNKVSQKIFQDAYPRFHALESVQLSETDLHCHIDLRPFMNPSPYSVPSSSTLPRMFKLFRSLGLRHLIVVDDANQVVGIVTRKDLVKFRVWSHRGSMGLEELTIYDRI